MGFRFRKSFMIAPGVRMNVSKSGVSTSVGLRGATLNIGKKGVRGTVSVPGTGLSYSERLDVRTSSGSNCSSGLAFWVLALLLAILAALVLL